MTQLRLPNEELVRMVLRAQKGDKLSCARVVQSLQRLIQSEIKKVFGCVPRRDNHDLMQESNVGLMLAIARFDPTKGAFVSYAILWIRQHIMDFLRHSPIVSLRGFGNRSSKVFFRAHKEISDEDLAETSKLPVEEVKLIRGAVKCCVSLSPAGNGDSDTCDRGNLSMLPRAGGSSDPTDAHHDDISAREIILFLETSKDRNQKRNYRVLAARLRGDTLDDIATREHISRERVRQIEKGTLARVTAKLAEELRG